MKNLFILLVFSFTALAKSDQDIQQDGQISDTRVDYASNKYQQISSNFNTAKKDSSGTFQTYTVKPLIEFATSQRSIADQSKAFVSLYDDMKWVYPDNPFFKPKPKIEHYDIPQTSNARNPDSNHKPLSEQINNLQSIVTGSPVLNPKPVIDLIDELHPIFTEQPVASIKPSIDLLNLSKSIISSTNLPDIEVLNTSQTIATDNTGSKYKPLSEFLSTSQLILSKPVNLADRFIGSSNAPEPNDNEQPVVNSKPVTEFFNNLQPSFSNRFDLSEKPAIEHANTLQPIDTVHPIVKKKQLTESEKPAIESVSIPQPNDNKYTSIPEKPINQLLEIPQHLPFEAQPLRGLLDDLNSLGLLEKPTTNIEFNEPLPLSSPSRWPSGIINADVQQTQNQIPPFSLVYPDPDIELSRRISLAASLQRLPTKTIFQEQYLPLRNDFRLAPVIVSGRNPPLNPWNLLVPTLPTGGYENSWYPQYPVYPTSNIEEFEHYGISGQGQFNYGNVFQHNPLRISLQPFPLQSGNYLDRKLTHQQLQELFNSLLINNYGKPYNTNLY